MNRTDEGGHSIFFLYPLINLFPVDRSLLRGLNPQPHLFSLNLNDADLYVITNCNTFSQLPCQYKH
jgi:hypothetical protein